MKVTYAIDRSSDRRRQFSISPDGTVSIQRRLDRETLPSHQVKILAVDDGDPPKTATATLTVTVQVGSFTIVDLVLASCSVVIKKPIHYIKRSLFFSHLSYN